MQKKVIALAVAALASGAAMAQSNVTVYGIADAVGTSFTTNNAVTGMMKNQRGFDDGAVGSRIGFKGTEDLGNGLKAEFQYELGIAPTNAIQQTNANGQLNNLSTRTASIALTSAQAGQIAMGRFHSLGWEFMANARPWGGLDPFRTMGNAMGITAHTSDRISNAIQYTTPTFSGVSARAQYSADARSGAGDQNTNDQTYVQNGTVVTGKQPVFLAGVKYEQGPIAAQVIYKNIYKLADASTDAGRKEWGIRGAYDFGVVKVGAVYQHVTLNTKLTVAGNNYESGYYYGGYVTVPIGSSFLLTGEAAKAKGDANNGGYGYMVNGQYLFSKRTSVYAQAGYMKMNGENFVNGSAATGYATNLGSYGSTPIEAGKHLTGFMAGILHTF